MPVSKNDLIKKLSSNVNSFGQRRYFEKYTSKEEREEIESSMGDTLGEKIYTYCNSIEEKPRCPCGNELEFVSFKEGYRLYCSRSCKASNQKKSDEWKRKMTATYRKTMLERYGVENGFQLESVKEKIWSNVPDRSEVIKKSVETRRKRRLGRCEPPKTREFDKNDYVLVLNKRRQKERERLETIELVRVYEERGFEVVETHRHAASVVTGTVKCKTCGFTYDVNFRYQKPRCVVCNPKKSVSDPELEFFDFLRSIYEGPVVRNDRSKIKPFELDFYLPEKRLALEYNGVYWHAFKDHLSKRNRCLDLGIGLVQVFDTDYESFEAMRQDLTKAIYDVGSYSLLVEREDDRYLYHDNKWPYSGDLETFGIAPPRRTSLKVLMGREDLKDKWVEDCGFTIYKKRL